jgi:branched-chain amino acid transport system ATP-binding protein
MSDKILEVKGLSISYGGIRAVRELDFHVNRGEIVSLIGANGAGKSSTLRAISGLVKAESGNVKFESEEIVG